ncbi:hypothetical protein B0H17DRAFT_1090588 [Mycena rosella]|uniref:F-box domain-containing protein n=1 Tax=Mycena rosella TaxID=1033263 RepID=A0AAD7CVW6_MYCRO|nr:hypothetical protein B0H17DRAFT_1090588 [Mycena rosella]
MSASCATCGSVLQPVFPATSELSAPNHLLETNDPPVEVEIQTTREIIAHEENQIRLLDQNILHLQNLLALVKQQRDESKQKIRRHSCILSPIRKLPTEILCNIFSFTLLPDDEMKERLSQESSNFGIGVSPWVLTHVCARWRNISLSFSSLWVTIILPLDTYYDMGSEDSDSEEPDSVAYPPNMLDAQLIRSGNAALSVVIDDPRPPSHILNSLLTSSPRWESLQCPAFSGILPLLSGRVPLLRRVYIDTSTGDTAHHTDGPVLDAPALRDISLRGIIPVVLPWAQLTRYEARGQWVDHLHVLRQTVNLLECHLWLLGMPSPPDEIVEVPSLRTLYLHNTRSPVIPGNLVLPALKDLFIDVSPPRGLPCLRDSRRLKRIAVMMASSIDFIVQLFQQCPNITDICIPYLAEEHLVNLFRDLTGTQSVLPALERIALYSYRPSGPVTCEGLLDFIRSRRTNDPRPTLRLLQSISFGGRFGIELDLALDAKLRELEQDRLELIIEPAMQLKKWRVHHGWAVTNDLYY